MLHPSVIALVGILQTHGLSVKLLQLMVEHCENRRTGGIALSTVEGRILKYEMRACGTVPIEDD